MQKNPRGVWFMLERVIRVAIVVVLAGCFALLVRGSILRGDMQEVQSNASKICLSCMGLN
jgi:FlaG/FlaF family flagellin (archaellin)